VQPATVRGFRPALVHGQTVDIQPVVLYASQQLRNTEVVLTSFIYIYIYKYNIELNVNGVLSSPMVDSSHVARMIILASGAM